MKKPVVIKKKLIPKHLFTDKKTLKKIGKQRKVKNLKRTILSKSKMLLKAENIEWTI